MATDHNFNNSETVLHPSYNLQKNMLCEDWLLYHKANIPDMLTIHAQNGIRFPRYDTVVREYLPPKMNGRKDTYIHRMNMMRLPELEHAPSKYCTGFFHVLYENDYSGL